MLDSAVQVSVGYLPDNPKSEQDRKDYFASYYLKNRQKFLTKRKTYYLNNKTFLWSNYFTCKKPYCLTCISQGIKETQYKLCGNNCLVQHWLLIYSQIYSKKNGVEQNVEQFSPHTRNDSLNSTHTPVSRLRAYIKNRFFFTTRVNILSPKSKKASSKSERQKRKDQTWRRLATKNKIAQTAGYNLPTHREKRTLNELLKQYGEYSYLTGKLMGNYYLSTLDIDLRKEIFPEKMIVRLKKNTDCLLDSLRMSYDKTKKGLHVDILTPKPLDNEIIYYQGWNDKGRKQTWNIGSIQSKGRYVVGEDKEKEFIKNGKWYWKVSKNEEIKTKLAKFFFISAKQLQTNQTPTQSTLSNSTIKQIKQIIQAQILSVNKTPLIDFLKVFYWNSGIQKRDYFLLNTYQRSDILSNLNIGSTGKMLLVNGIKHKFLNRLL